MNAYKFIKYFGLSFLLLGLILALAGLAFSTPDGADWVLPMVGAIFALVGGIFFFIGIALTRGGRRILREGEPFQGKIFDYDYDHSVTMNGAPLLVLVVRYFDADGRIREALVPTGTAGRARFPLGATVSFRLLDGKAALEGKPGSDPLPDEYRLLQGGIDVGGTAPTVGVHCPNCNAVVNVPMGLGAPCPYCGTMIRVDEKGQVL